MTYKAFNLTGNEINFRIVLNWIDKMKNSEMGLISQCNERGYRVHEYKLDEGALVQIVGTIDNDWGSMERSYFKNFRVLGSEGEINKFIDIYHKNNGPGNPLREIRVLESTDVGTLDISQLKKLSKEGFVIKYEFKPIIVDTTPLFQNG